MNGLQQALPKRLYVDPAAFADERERVLLREWTCVGRLSDLGLGEPGRFAAVGVLGESVLVGRDDDGLHAAYNLCRHRGSQLIPHRHDAEPVLGAARALRCPYHSWTYALDGRLLRAPHTDNLDPPLDPSGFGLCPVEVGEWAGFVFVRLEPGTEGLAEAVARPDRTLARYGLGELVTGLCLDYDVAANWKVVAENYNECYHCGPVHPELCRLVPAFGGGGADLDWDAGVPHREGAWTFTLSGTTARAPLPGLDDAERVRHKGELVYPNLMLSCSADHVAAFRLVPLAVDRTRIECRLLFHPDAVADPGFDPTDAGDLWDLVNRQDWAICESVQRGMSSRAHTRGWFAPMEDDSADIRRWLLPRLGEEES